MRLTSISQLFCLLFGLLLMPRLAAAPVDSLRITEIMYNSPEGSDFEYIEFLNTSATDSLNLASVSITNAVRFTFPIGTTMLPGAVFVVAKDPGATFNAFYNIGVGTPIFGPYSGNLANGGERIRVLDGGNEIIDFEYNDGRGWPCEADGPGHSIVPLVLNNQRNGALDIGANWRASASINGSPGQANPAQTARIVINEIAPHTDFNNPSFPAYDSNDWIELFNPTSAALSLNDLYLSDDPTDLRKWAIPGGSLPAAGFVSFDEITGFHTPITEGFGLSKAGETVYLSHLPSNAVQRVLDCVPYDAVPNSVGWGRFPDGGEFFRLLQASRGSSNGPLIPGLIFTEFMYHPEDIGVGTNGMNNTRDEYIELFNPTTVAIPLSTVDGPYEIKGSVDFTFPFNASVAPGQSILIVSFDPLTNTVARAAFEAEYGISGTTLYGPYSGTLPNGMGRIAITRPDPPDVAGDPPGVIVIEEVIYTDRSPWDPDADGLGDSLHRIAALDSSNDPANWTAMAPMPGDNTGGTNTPPTLALIPAQSGSVGNQVQFFTSATDPNTGQTISYSLAGGLPSGASINPSTGVFTWTPTATGSFTTTIVATDDGSPPQSDQQDVVITVIGANTPPSLLVPATVTGIPGTPLTFTATASDPDAGQVLTFAAFGGPSGASIDSMTGVFTWTPSTADLGSTLTVNIAVADNGTPAGTDLKQVELVVSSVAPPTQPVITDMILEVGPPGATLEFSATAGVQYQIETAPDISNPVWSPGPTITASATLATIRIDHLTPSQILRFYRIVALP